MDSSLGTCGHESEWPVTGPCACGTTVAAAMNTGGLATDTTTCLHHDNSCPMLLPPPLSCCRYQISTKVTFWLSGYLHMEATRHRMTWRIDDFPPSICLSWKPFVS